MKLIENISVEDFNGKTYKVRVVEPASEKEASYTHYLHNYKNGVSHFYKDGAIEYVKGVMQKKYPNENITQSVAEDALQYLITFKETIPFPKPKTPSFKFIDLFAGIGGFRLALQNLGGNCVFTSEWDKYSQKTYQANFGEVPFGDILKLLLRAIFLIILMSFVRVFLVRLFQLLVEKEGLMIREERCFLMLQK